ncbi:MAG: class I SAM-dependent RNA methyltransferase [Lachnospiraceae bacterium]|nr:class I SAM-dependent RNA methyltransferase [Lachnospiraceae bacterium]
MKRGEIYEGTVVRVDFPDRAVVVTDEGEEVLVKFGLPGQRLRFRLKKHKKSRPEGILLEVLERSPKEDPDQTCAHFGICGGCICQSLPYEEQLAIKEKQIRQLLDHVCRDYEFEGIEASPVTSGYRNKMELSFGDEYKDGPLALGMHQRGSFYDIVTVSDCRMMHEDMKLAASCILEHMKERQIAFLHRMRHQGVLRHLLLRRSAASGELLVGLVTTSQDMSRGNGGQEGQPLPGLTPDQMASYLDLEGLTEKLKALPYSGRLGGFLHIVNDSLADVVQSDETILLYGQPEITDRLLGLSFQITPFSFFQTNSAGAEVLYSVVRDYIGETKDRLIFDLYSGTGTIAQVLAPVAKRVVGVEIVEEAVEAARINAKANGLENCRFLAGDVLKVLDEIEEKPELIVLDPPRDGIHPKALPKILNYQVPRIVYVSCKPTSLVRDYEMFVEMGYRMVKARAVDLFPGTAGIETVALFEKEGLR